jgi:GNAT superfamily N-acetyltransferase
VKNHETFPELTIAIEENSIPEDCEKVRTGLRQFNLLHAPADNHLTIEIFLRDAKGEIFGGLLGDTYWGWLYVGILWVDESVRGQGYGHRLLHAAEEEALKRGCHSVHLDTMSFQAQPFYEKEGYAVFGVLPDLPKGHERIFLYKSLANS